MSEANLISAKYFDDADSVDSVQAADESIEAAPSSTARWEHAASRLSMVVAVGLIVCVTILAVGYLTLAKDRVTTRAKKSSHPLDWLLWFGGAKEDQTFEKFIKDSTAKSQREWEERYRNSPAYQFRAEDLDWKKMQWKAENMPAFTKPVPRKANR